MTTRCMRIKMRMTRRHTSQATCAFCQHVDHPRPRERSIFNWHQHIAIQILKKDYHATEHILERVRYLDVIGDKAYQHEMDRLGWWWRMTFNWITAPGSSEEKRARIRMALQHFRWVGSKITCPMIAKERQLPHTQRLAQLSAKARLKLAEAQQAGISWRILVWRLEGLERLFSARLAELIEMDGLAPDDRADRADDLIAAYYKVLQELLNRFSCDQQAA
jgi:hypothetical protein